MIRIRIEGVCWIRIHEFLIDHLDHREGRERKVSFGAENATKTYQKTTFHHPPISIFPGPKPVLDSTAMQTRTTTGNINVNNELLVNQKSEALPANSSQAMERLSTNESELNAVLSTQRAKLVRVDSQLSDISAFNSGIEEEEKVIFKKKLRKTLRFILI